MVHNILNLLPTEGSTVKISFYLGTDPVKKEEIVTWNDNILHDYHVTEWEEI